MFVFDDAKLEALCPPDGFIERPGGNRANFLPIGKFYADLWLQKGLIKPDSWVFDLGCSVGRMAIPLTQVLTADSAYYHGIDCVQSSVEWCDQNITPKFPHFSFGHLDVFSTYYNPQGKHQPEVADFTDGCRNMFDFLFATSVFTHMGRPAAFNNYMRQINEILIPGGKAFLTFFLLDRAGSPGAKQSFQHVVEPGAVAVFEGGNYDSVSTYGLDYINAVAKSCGLGLAEMTRGSWAAPDAPTEPYQDLLTFTKV